jgi:ornithine cyclodeaminase/alanine dehydrogenase-like protein (mu-crystallin family)
VLVLNAAEVRQLLDLPGCIEAVEAALVAAARGEVLMPLRMMVRPADRSSVLGLMPVHRAGATPVYALKSVAVFPANAAHGLDPHQGTVTLFDGVSGVPVAVMNAEPITAIRTAAATAVATRALARPESRVVAVIGAGHQARAHVAALRAVCDVDTLRVASRTPASAQALADEVDAVASPSIEAAVAGADIVVTVTSSATPVVSRDWLAPGAHVNAVGACFPETRELDSPTIAAARLFTDRLESLRSEAGDFLIPQAEGVLGPDYPVVELGSVLAGLAAGRQSPEELTVFKSLGIAVEDMAAAEYVVARARETGAGTEVTF